jgi:hypothetical protein
MIYPCRFIIPLLFLLLQFNIRWSHAQETTPTTPLPPVPSPTTPTSNGSAITSDRCYICGSPTNELVDPSQTVLFPTNMNNTNNANETLQLCSDLQVRGMTSTWTPADCFDLQTAGCDCDDTDFLSSPTSSPGPSITYSPTLENPCHVCGTSTNPVSNPNQMVFMLGELYSCRELQESAPIIPSSLCIYVQSSGCQCTEPFDSLSNEVPTISPATTGTDDEETFELCSICGSPPNRISDPYQIVYVDPVFDDVFENVEFTCGDLVRKLAFTVITRSACARMQNAGCQCTSPFIPRYETCQLCGNEQYKLFNTSDNSSLHPPTTNFMSYPNHEMIRSGNDLYYCYDLYTLGLKGFLPSDMCQESKQRIQQIKQDPSLIIPVVQDPSLTIPMETGCTCILKGTQNNNTNNDTMTKPTSPSSSSSSSNDPPQTVTPNGIIITAISVTSLWWIFQLLAF